MQEEDFNTPQESESEGLTPETPQENYSSPEEKLSSEENIIPEELVSAMKEEEKQSSDVSFSEMAPSGGKLPSIGSLFGRAFQIYGENFSKFFVLSLIFILLIYGSVILATLLFGGGSLLGFASGNKTAGLTTLGIMGIFYIFALVFISGYFSAALMAGLIFILKEREEKKSFSEVFGKAFSFAFRRGFALWWVLILVGFVITGSLFLLIIPGIMFFVWFLFSTYSCIYERKNGMNALMYSRDLIQGYWWRTFLRILLLLVLLVGINLLLALITPDSSTVNVVINILEGLIISPFVIVFYGLIYEDLKSVKAGQEISGVTTGRKAKYILTSVAGYVLSIVLIIIASATLVNKFKDLKFDETTFPTMDWENMEITPPVEIPEQF